jgi:ribose 5-phosphate isomerase A
MTMPSDPTTTLANRALEYVRTDAVIGLGAGRAAAAFVRALAARVGEGLRIRGVPASEATATLACELGIPLTGLEEPAIDVTIDGADEVDPQLDLIKGYGGALARERIVAAASLRQIILVEADKLVPVLGSRGRLPVEVLTFAVPLCRRRLEALGLAPKLRTAENRWDRSFPVAAERGGADASGGPFVTDNGNFILDCTVGPIGDARALDQAIRAIPGIVDTGLFLGTASIVLVAEGTTIREMTRAKLPRAPGARDSGCAAE